MILLIFGCVQYDHVHYDVQQDAVQEMPTGFQSGDSIVVLSEAKSLWHSYEKDIAKCISQATKDLSIFSSDKFHKIVLSDLNLPENYSIQKAIDQIFKNESILKRIEPLNIHYIVLITQYQIQKQSDAEFSDIIFGNAFIFPDFDFKEKRKILSKAVVFDLKRKGVSGEVISSVYAGWRESSVGYWNSPKGLIENRACEDFAVKIVKFISGKDPDVKPTAIKKIKSVKSAVKQENGDIKVCAELANSMGLGSFESYIINLPLSSLKDGVADLETLGFRKEGCKGNIVYTEYDYGRRKYCADDIIYYFFPIEKTQKDCSQISSESLTMGSVLPIEKLTVNLKKIGQLSSLLNSRNKEHPYLERVYEVNFVSDEEGIAIENGDDGTKETLGKNAKEIRLVYYPPQIAQEASNMPIFPMGFSGGYDREDQDATF
jgi:hypothetical protein